MNAREEGLIGEARGGWPCSQGTGAPADLIWVRRARPLLGTFVEIAATAASPDETTEAAIDAAFDAVGTVHRLMSFHDGDSDVSRLNRDAASVQVIVHPWTFEVLATALDLHRQSEGVFDIAVAPVLQDLGLLPRHDGETPVRSNGVGEPFVMFSDGRVAFRDRRVRIDLGGIAKGFAVDRAIDVLRSGGIVQGIVNAGGDLAAFGPSPEVIHIRDPRDPARAMCLVEVANAALATSGGRFDPTAALVSTESTVIDPRTAAPVTGVLGATVRAHSCMLADALTKIVMAMGEAAMPLLAHYGASALLVSEHGVHITRDWQGGVRLAA
jgi:thiamine biosynthesis lipoprotein